MPRGPDRQRAFAEIAQHRQQEALPAQQPAHVAGADAAAARLAHVLPGAKANEVIARGEAPESIGGESNPACLAPVGRPQLFHPRHILCQIIIRRLSAHVIAAQSSLGRAGMGTKNFA